MAMEDTMYFKMNEELKKVRKMGLDWVYEQFKKRNIESINVREYVINDCIGNYLFYDCDDDCYGLAMELTEVKVVDGKILLEMYCNEEFYETLNVENLNATEMMYFVDMMESIFDGVDLETLPLLKVGETFD